MPKQIVDAPIREQRGDNALTVPASTGTPLCVNFRQSFREVLISFPSTAAVRMGFTPMVLDAYFFDESATGVLEWIRLTTLGAPNQPSMVDREAIDHPQVTSTTYLDSMTTSDFIYVCFSRPSGGVYFDVVNANANAATASAGYIAESDVNAFTALTIATDGTASGGATLAVDGAMTWTTPTDWRRTSLRALLGGTTAPELVGYWCRISVSAGLDAATSIQQIVGVAAAVSERGTYKLSVEYSLRVDESYSGGLDFLSTGAATTVDLTWYRRSGG